MDRSVDSIGSCSLDVDADSSDISDTSGSLNFPTPISIKDITREFTANIRERCSVRTVQTSSTAIVDPVRGKVRTVLTQPIGGVTFIEPSALPAHAVDDSCEKKPSYLNLACCVNGYSNITTYDSKIRQDINKSREVSPIRPSSNSIHYCKKSNSLAPPVLLPMPTISSPGIIVGEKYSTAETNNNSNGRSSNGHDNIDGRESLSTAGVVGNGTTSFIQQRVERLYGPGALAQGFYSPKKLRGSSSARSYLTRPVNADASELTRKFQELSPGKDYGEFRKKLSISAPSSARCAGPVVAASLAPSQMENTDVDLPVMRHLSQEFRAQLPTISPKKNFMRSCASKEDIVSSMNGGSVDSSKVALEGGDASKHVDEVDHKVVAANVTSLLVEELPAESRETQKGSSAIATTTKDCLPEKDGNHFILLLKNEQARLLAIAIEVEKYIDALTDNPEIAEDIFGLLRSASGKARLLVTQKMKQFEGLCHNNLNRSPEDKFPTTLDDLQGFWDMVNLQVDHIDAIFAEIEAIKNNDWKHTKETAMPAPNASKSYKPIKTVNNARAKPVSTANGGAAAAKTSAALTAAALKRESQRKQLQEMRRKQRQALANNSMAVESAAVVAGDRAVEGNALDSPVALLIAENGCAAPN